MQGKVLVVTGAAGALGRVVAARAEAQGAIVAPIVRGGPEGVDLGDAAVTQAAMARIRAAHGRIDALANIAGGFVWRPVAEAAPEDWTRMSAINLQTAVNASRAALAHLSESGGAIVNIGAASAILAGAGMGPYAAAKAGVHKLTESLAEEMKGKMRVNAVLPTIIDTPQNRADMPNAAFGDWVAPEALADVILFLASDAARALTGALVPVSAPSVKRG